MTFDQVRPCTECGSEFKPKPMGYNARYCSDRCKRRNQRARRLIDNPEQLQAARARSYQATKAHSDRIEKHRASGRKTHRAARQWLAASKMEIGCVDCGYRAHAAALQLDHEGPKAVAISEARSSIARLQAEILSGKCKVRCAICHAIRTWETKQKNFVGENSGEVGRGCGEMA